MVRTKLYTALSLIALLALGVLDKGCTSLPLFRTSIPSSGATPGGYVTRSGSQLMLNGRPFRFAGANIHWLALDDSTSYPSSFRVNDALDAAKAMGATVVRSHSLGISVGCGNCIEPAPGVFNETALVHDDYVIKAAGEHGIRLIIPLTDNYHYAQGGKHTFTDWRGIPNENQFYYNHQVMSDFELYIRTLLNRVNTYTGVAYKNDPTIMAWETGNELAPPTSWTQIISTYIKSIDHNHLVLDGRRGVDPNAVSLTNVDIVSDHYYPKSISELTNGASAAKKAGKAFVVGEFDWNDANGGDALSSFLSTIESDSVVTGDLFWELWAHDDQYGYVSNGIQYTLHCPADSVAMATSVNQLRIHAFKMREIALPTFSAPGVPLIGVVIRNAASDVLVWRGASLAASYSIERSTSGASGPWTVICNRCATDSSTPWVDMTAPAGALWYRVIAYGLSGVAGSPSSPYQAGSGGIIIDNLDNWSKAFDHSSNLTFDTTNSQYMNGDPSRVMRTTATHESIIWRQAHMTSFQAIAYLWPSEAVSHFSIDTSSDGKIWRRSHPVISSIYSNWLEYIYTLNGLSKVNYVRMVWNNSGGRVWDPELGEVAITY
ncbi:MAG TPA: hypothetical protein VKB35_13290 [Ktedonobacteraceae bacterium]|nr:hypothetical protein [Ktedonobacteraceae bacterium]